MTEIRDLLEKHIRDVPDFPKPGILFKDITPVLQDPECLRRIIDHFVSIYAGESIDRIVGIESRGFIFGTALAYAMGLGISLVRKPGKLPWKVEVVQYALEYGTDELQMHTDAVTPGQRVLVVDDLLATGGTAAATCELVRRLGAEVAGCAFVIELGFLNGAARLEPAAVHSILTY
jgi:adenine phosphoribosyltransferase